MKCPKCGFNSFEIYDNCKKCSGDLIAYKNIYSIKPLVLPLEAKEKLAAELISAESEDIQLSDTIESHDDIFSFDIRDNSSTAAQNDNDPFNFDEHLSEAKESGGLTSGDDLFANLLESSLTIEKSPFGDALADTAVSAVKAVKASEPLSGPGDFDLENFSWDDTPSADSASVSKDLDDNFDSLFGDMNENAPK